jgi:hypothetical protein
VGLDRTPYRYWNSGGGRPTLLRPCRERVVRIEQPTSPAELDQRRLDPRALRSERRQPEDPPEVIPADGGMRMPVVRTARGGDARGVERDSTHAGAHRP